MMRAGEIQMNENRELLFSIGPKDFKWDFFRASGKGGQKLNKTSSACRCTHIASGAVGLSSDGRSQWQNRKMAFTRCVNTNKFKNWHKNEVNKKLLERSYNPTNLSDADIEEKIKNDLKNIKVEVLDENGEWVEEIDN